MRDSVLFIRYLRQLSAYRTNFRARLRNPVCELKCDGISLELSSLSAGLAAASNVNQASLDAPTRPCGRRARLLGLSHFSLPPK